MTCAMEWLFEQAVTTANTIVVLILLVLMNQLWVIYDMWNMPPGPRLTSIPFVGNLFNFDQGSAVEGRSSIAEHTQRFGNSFALLYGLYRIAHSRVCLCNQTFTSSIWNKFARVCFKKNQNCVSPLLVGAKAF